MKNYRGLIVGLGILSGIALGYYYRQDFPPGTRYIQGHILRTENDITKTATGISGGAVAGFIGGLSASLVLEHITKKKSTS